MNADIWQTGGWAGSLPRNTKHPYMVTRMVGEEATRGDESAISQRHAASAALRCARCPLPTRPAARRAHRLGHQVDGLRRGGGCGSEDGQRRPPSHSEKDAMLLVSADRLTRPPSASTLDVSHGPNSVQRVVRGAAVAALVRHIGVTQSRPEARFLHKDLEAVERQLVSIGETLTPTRAV